MPLHVRAHIARIALVASGVAIASAVAACTLLARFDDLPPLADSGADAAIDAQPGDASSADVSTTDAASDAARLDAGPDVDPCSGQANGSYCGEDGLGYTGHADDLVECDGGAIARITACDAGCLALSNPFPDTCNGCNTKPNGAYCGRDFPDFPSRDSDWLIQCQVGNAVQKTPCANGCASNGAASSCL